MTAWQLLKAELTYRKLNFAMSLFAVIAAAALFVASPTLLRAYKQESSTRMAAQQAETDSELETMQSETDAELATLQSETDQELQRMETEAEAALKDIDKRTKRIMRDLGFNLRIVDQRTDMTKLFANFESFPMPESYVQKLADAPEITKIVHLVATLKKMIEWNDQPRLLVGFAPETQQSHIEKKPPMGFNIKPGTVYLGHLSGEGIKVGEKVDVLGEEFEVTRILPPHGNRDEDILVAMHLDDAQRILKMEDQITEILALGCKCETIERVAEITAQLELVLPNTKVTELRVQAIAREEQRNLVTKHYKQTMANYETDRTQIVAQEAERRQAIVDRELAARESIAANEQEHHNRIATMLSQVTNFATPLIILVCAIWVGMLAWTNVRERRSEIGLLRALGRSTPAIGALFLGKAALLGVIGGLVGCALGFGLSVWVASVALGVQSVNFPQPWDICIYAILGAPLLAAMASYLPTLAAVTQDPAVVLMDH